MLLFWFSNEPLPKTLQIYNSRSTIFARAPAAIETDSNIDKPVLDCKGCGGMFANVSL